MATNARTFYFDEETYSNLGLLAGMKRSSRSSVIRSMIYEEVRQIRNRQGSAKRPRSQGDRPRAAHSLGQIDRQSRTKKRRLRQRLPHANDRPTIQLPSQDLKIGQI